MRSHNNFKLHYALDVFWHQLRHRPKSVVPQLLRLEPGPRHDHIRNTSSKHWQQWLGPENRCLVPFTSFSEFNKAGGSDVWFAFSEARPLALFAGIWTPGWTCVRKMKTGVETVDLFGFLTTEPSESVASIHQKAMPVCVSAWKIPRRLTVRRLDVRSTCSAKQCRQQPPSSLLDTQHQIRNDFPK